MKTARMTRLSGSTELTNYRHRSSTSFVAVHRDLPGSERYLAGLVVFFTKAWRQTMSLVISRHTQESIMIGDEIEVYVAEIRGDKVRLSIRAPKSVPVHRLEIWNRIQEEKEAAK